MNDRKKIAAMLVMGLKKKPTPDESAQPTEPDGDEAEPSDHEAAAQEVMDALKSDDVAGFAEALKSFVKMCNYSDDDGDEE